MEKKLALEVDDEAPPSSRRPARPETTADAHARIGQMLASKYKLDAIIGSGGMGHVYRATNTLIGRTVAIKLLRREHASNASFVERFLREARTANLVQHPNIVDVIDVGTADDGVPFLVQEYLEGETLLAYAERHKNKIPITELIEIMGPVLSAVADAHDRNVVHRDLKPENVFLAGVRKKRVPKVLDFGISKVRGLDGEITSAGVMMGTPAYMAPELAVSSKDADSRADVWALGVIVFEMLTGQLPFEGESVLEVLRAVTTVDARKLSDVAPHLPASVSRVVERCLSRDPNQRYANARELGIALAGAFEESAPAAVEQWSLRPGTASSPPAAMPDMPKPAKIPTATGPSTLVGLQSPSDAPPGSGKTTTLVMEGAPSSPQSGQQRPVDASASRAMARGASPPPAPSPVAATAPPPVVPSTPRSTPRGGIARADAKATARTRKPPRISTKALVILGALVVIVLVEVVIFLKLAG